jgi:hypothetical protein
MSQARVIPYSLFERKSEITWEDVKKACFGNLSPFTPSEMAELLTLQNDDEKFFTRMFEMLKNENTGQQK